MFEEILYPSSPLFWLLILSILAAVALFIARNFRTYVKFIYPNAKFEAIGNPFIQEKELNILIENPTLESLKDRLNVLRDYQVQGQTASSIQRSLDENLLRTIRMMRTDSSKKLAAFYDLYLQKIDFYLVKNEIKTLLRGTGKKQALDAAVLPQTKDFLVQLQNTTKESLPAVLTQQGFSKESIEKLMAEPVDLLQIDIIFDHVFLTRLRDVKVPRKCDQPKQDFIKNTIDMLTVKHLLRAKHLALSPDTCKRLYLGEGKQISRWRFDQMADAADVPQLVSALDGTSYYPALSAKTERYGKEHSAQVFEQAVDAAFLQRIKEISLQNYLTFGPSLRFLVSKEYEIKNLKVITKGIAENSSVDLIKNNLVKEVAL